MAYPETRTDRLLDAVHDYVPQRMQAWIEERAFNKQVEAANGLPSEDAWVQEQGEALKYRSTHNDLGFSKDANTQEQEKEPDYAALGYRSDSRHYYDSNDYAEAYADVANDATLRWRLENESPMDILADVRRQVHGYDTHEGIVSAPAVTQEERTAGFLRAAATNTQDQTAIQQQGQQVEQSRDSGMER